MIKHTSRFKCAECGARQRVTFRVRAAARLSDVEQVLRGLGAGGRLVAAALKALRELT